ncbi:AmmeMemoRadiSam system protein B [Candidatus Uhrbacteria bacterium]|nr:AmmeMemoRadiSam system protein B [Candidatus Uhrbacteria bacterium]
MKHLSIIILIAISIALAMLMAFRPAAQEPVSPPSYEHSIDAERFLDRARFMRGLAQAPLQCPIENPRAAVVNHHALMSDLMARIIMPLGDCLDPKPSIIIISPDHFGKSASSVAFHRINYHVDGHQIQIDTDAATRLETGLLFAKEQAPIFENEHGVGALVPFLASSIPDARILPLIVKRSITDQELSLFTEYLAHEISRGTFILVSSDMSHYLGEVQAKQNDRQTIDAFTTSNAEFFARADDDYTDNGRALAAVIRALGPTSFTFVDRNKISSEIDGANTFTTTYITGFWE